MPLIVPAYQAAGAMEIYLSEARAAESAIRGELQASLTASEVLSESLDEIEVLTQVGIMRRMTRRLTRAVANLDRYEQAVEDGLAFLEHANGLSKDHRSTIEVPVNLVEMVLPYLDDALEDLVDTVFAMGAEQIDAQRLTRDDVRRSLPKFSPQTAVPRLL